MRNGSKWFGVTVLGCLVGLAGCAAEVASTADGTEVAPSLAENGDLRVAAPPDGVALVNVHSHRFEDEAALFRFAMDEMGGEPVYDDEGNLIGVRGSTRTAGEVRYRDMDSGEIFEADDLAQAMLGGAAGTIEVAGEVLRVGEPSSLELAEGVGATSAALSDESEGCVGDDCVAGKSWKRNYLVYRSVGSRTTQRSGGLSNQSYQCCRQSQLVWHEGRRQCRFITEAIPPSYGDGHSKPIPTSYGYRPTQTCSREVLRNSLTLSVMALGPGGRRISADPVTEYNTRKVERSNWGVGVGVSFLGIDDVTGVCGYHSGSRGARTQTRAGDATDAICGTPFPVLNTTLIRP